METRKIKTYADTYVYNASTSEEGSFARSLIEFIRTSDRINVNSTAFEQVRNQVKVRQTTAVLYRILMNKNVVLCMNGKEAPASFKVFMAKDVLTNKDKKVFIDVTGLLKMNNGMYYCKEIDKLCAYLIMALVQFLYYDNNQRLIDDNVVCKASMECFIKLFTGILDNLRVANFAENRIKISYIAGVYYGYAVMGKPLDSARKYAATVTGINLKDAGGYDYWYKLEDFKDINKFITFLADAFHLNGLTTGVFLVRYMQMYGKGTIFGLEILPSFISIITNAYSGSFINSQKTIEKFCGREMINLSTEILRLGAEIYSNGFTYESNAKREDYE